MKDARRDPKSALKHDVAYSDSLGIAGQKYKTSAEGTEQSTDDFRGGGEKAGVLKNTSARNDGSVNPSFAQGGEGAASVASGIGAKPQEDDDNVIDANFNKDKESFNNDIMPKT